MLADSAICLEMNPGICPLARHCSGDFSGQATGHTQRFGLGTGSDVQSHFSSDFFAQYGRGDYDRCSMFFQPSR